MMSLMPCTAWRKNIVGDAERFKKARPVLYALHQPLVGNHDDGVDAADQLRERLLRLLHAALAFKREWLRHHRYRERAEFARQIRHHRRSAAAGAAAKPGRDEHHVRPVERFENFLRVFERRLPADLRIRPRAEPLRQLRAELQFHRRLRQLQRLQIRIRGNEFDALHLRPNHAIDGVRTAASRADHFYLRPILRLFRERNSHARIF